jgi:hypothetical protein
MRPESIVLLYHKDELWRYELFYNRAKAERASKRASVDGRLETEDGERVKFGSSIPGRAICQHRDRSATTVPDVFRCVG